MDLEKRYIIRLTKEETGAPVTRKWYLPHHPVINPKKPGKVRRVCDDAAKFQGSSLNSHLLSGPDLLNNLVGIFMQFQEEKVALSGDRLFCLWGCEEKHSGHSLQDAEPDSITL